VREVVDCAGIRGGGMERVGGGGRPRPGKEVRGMLICGGMVGCFWGLVFEGGKFLLLLTAETFLHLLLQIA
jgi:hypothetical protein